MRALDALDGSYMEFEKFATGGNPGSWRVRHVSPDARRAVGQWPTAESLIARMVEGITEAAEHESDPQRKRKLREAACVLGGIAKDAVTEIVAKIIVHESRMG